MIAVYQEALPPPLTLNQTSGFELRVRLIPPRLGLCVCKGRRGKSEMCVHTCARVCGQQTQPRVSENLVVTSSLTLSLISRAHLSALLLIYLCSFFFVHPRPALS
jgi:hypothetical protein